MTHWIKPNGEVIIPHDLPIHWPTYVKSVLTFQRYAARDVDREELQEMTREVVSQFMADAFALVFGKKVYYEA